MQKHTRILIIGTGYVGLVSGTCFAELGAMVTCVDKDAEKIENLKKGIIPIFEKGLEELVRENHAAGRLKFSPEIDKEIKKADLIFIAVGTPPAKDGSADLSYIYSAAVSIAENAKDDVIIVTKSTVPVGTGEKLKALISGTNPGLKFDIASNPEFLREGNAVKDFLKPDRVVIGTEKAETFEKIAQLYRPIKNVNIINTPISTAEMTKYAGNAYLAMRVAFINEMADICEQVGADVDTVAKAIGLDHRIGPYFLKTGPGFGGSCFPKDTLALQKIAADAGRPSKIIDAVIRSNDERKFSMAEKIITIAGGSVKGKTIGILGLAFKANTDDIRDSSSLVIIEQLVKAGAKISAYDPEAMENARRFFDGREISNISYEISTEAVVNKSDIVAIVTEWTEFKSLNLHKFKLKPLIDMRNLYNAAQMFEEGIIYHSLGRAAYKLENEGMGDIRILNKNRMNNGYYST